MKIEVLYDQGEARFPEDGIVVMPPSRIGVFDCFSAPYVGAPPLVNGMTSGQTVRQQILLSLQEPNDLETAILSANRAVSCLPYDGLAGAAFVFAEIGERDVSIVQAADCVAVWKLPEIPEIYFTPNQFAKYEAELRRTFHSMLEQSGGDKTRAWALFRPFLEKHRREHQNRSYAVINGNPSIEYHWRKIEIPLPEVLLLFTDGFLVSGYEENLLAAVLYRHFLFNDGLRQALRWTRSNGSSEHGGLPEATAIAVRF
ncbi:MAG: hypothetical protein ABIF89_00840 [bacterium]